MALFSDNSLLVSNLEKCVNFSEVDFYVGYFEVFLSSQIRKKIQTNPDGFLEYCYFPVES